jgi:hypothetical protein
MRNDISLCQQYSRVYRALKKLGFSAAKSLEIIIDSKRRNKYALGWVKIARKQNIGL